ncbi:MAG: CRISPR-associated primase-polymerase type A1 [Candidatus Cloacimonetes bacterium]|nr:CRISPR-associated primase-polymerase type A1 [Candidatus Cloacimonadota bacterium]MDD3501760.1 CRISPR-associated primase-polymerase type A1 [Candidatus Cloacimonadota bacterium]
MENLGNIEKNFNQLILSDDYASAGLLIDGLFKSGINETDTLNFCKKAYEKLGNSDKVINCINLLLKDNNTNDELFAERAIIYYDQGKYNLFEKSLLTAIDCKPDEFSYYQSLVGYYKMRKQFFDAVTIMKTAYRHIPTDECKIELDSVLKLLQEDTVDIDSQTNNSKTKGINIEDQLILDMLNLFTGRENVYARQWKGDDDKSGYVPVREPLSFYEMKNHLLGQNTLGVYQLDLANQVKFLAIDLDVNKYAQKQYHENQRFKDFVDKGFREVCNLIKAALDNFNIPVYIENSGYKGFHAWIFLEEKINASLGLLFLKKVRTFIDVGKYPIQIELYPKQSKLNPDQIGNLIKIPLGIHLKTGNRCWFVDNNYKNIQDYSIISRIKLAKVEQLIAALNEWKGVLVEEPPKTAQQNDKHSDQYIPPIVEKKIQLETHAEYQWLISKCYVLRQIVAQIETKFELSNQERLTLSFTLGHLSNGAEIVNMLLGKCINVPQDAFLKNNFSGNPVSCPKIRARLTTLADKEKCNCLFSSLLNTYPNPLLHLQDLKQTNINVNQIDSVRLLRLIENYLNTKKEFNEIKKSIENQENIILDYLEHAGLDEIETSFGVLQIDNTNNKKQLSLRL